MHSIRLGDQDVKVVHLVTPKEQAQGFQFHKEIPKTYGLMFPNCGDHHFHMQNVGAPLLIVSLDDQHKVVGKEIRQPETLGKQVAKGIGKHIFELHPMYDPWIKIGKNLESSKREAQRKDYGWITPAGEFIPASHSHIRIVRDLKKDGIPVFEQGNAMEDAFKQGWVRVTFIGSDLYANQTYGKINQKQRKELIDSAIETGKKRVVLDNGTGDYVIWQKNGREAQSNIYSYWLSPDCILTKVENHYELLPKILGITLEEARQAVVLDTGSDKTLTDYYSKAFKLGWVRVIRARDILYFQGNPSARQLKELKDTAIEGGFQLRKGAAIPGYEKVWVGSSYDGSGNIPVLIMVSEEPNPGNIYGPRRVSEFLLKDGSWVAVDHKNEYLEDPQEKFDQTVKEVLHKYKNIQQVDRSEVPALVDQLRKGQANQKLSIEMNLELWEHPSLS